MNSARLPIDMKPSCPETHQAGSRVEAIPPA
jgi:hypothetical protein